MARLDPFMRNLDAFTRALGVENAPLIFSFSTLGWPDDATRDAFIQDLTGTPTADRETYGS
jgi:hypothetical protein